MQSAPATALHDAYFRDGVNVAGQRVGMDGHRVREFLATDEGGAAVRAQAAAARREGVTTVPTFVFDNGALVVGVTSAEALRQAAGR